VFGIFQRMILGELIKVFVMSLIVITAILLMAGIVAEASQHGLGPKQLLEAIPLLIPSTLPYTIPATTLFACCVVYGRLSSDNEILAIKAAGIHLIKVLTPALLLGVVMSAATMGLYYRIIPYTHCLLRSLVFNDAEEFIYTALDKHGHISNPALPFSMWVNGVQDRKLLNPLIKRSDASGKTDFVATAREGDLRVDLQRKVVVVHLRYGEFSTNTDANGQFVDRFFELELPANFGSDGQTRPPRDMSWQEILERKQELSRKLVEKTQEIDNVSKELAKPNPHPDRVKHRQNLDGDKKFFQQQQLALDVELLMRPALSIGCLCFILVGCPVGIWFHRSDYLSSFITCFLPIVLIYYPLMLCGTGFAKEGKFEPITLVWGANTIIGFIGLFLFRRLLRN